MVGDLDLDRREGPVLGHRRGDQSEPALTEDEGRGQGRAMSVNSFRRFFSMHTPGSTPFPGEDVTCPAGTGAVGRQAEPHNVERVLVVVVGVGDGEEFPFGRFKFGGGGTGPFPELCDLCGEGALRTSPGEVDLEETLRAREVWCRCLREPVGQFVPAGWGDAIPAPIVASRSGSTGFDEPQAFEPVESGIDLAEALGPEEPETLGRDPPDLVP